MVRRGLLLRRFILAWIALLAIACGSSSRSKSGPPPSSQPAPSTPTADGSGAVAVLQLDGTPGHGTAPDTEKFDGSASYSKNPQAQISTLRWSFGDGSEPTTGAKASHTFMQPGTFVVTLAVTDSDGSTATSSISVDVAKPPDSGHPMVAVARFDGTPGHGAAPDTEKFDGTGSHSGGGASLDHCHWTFGDGASADGCKAQHVFQVAGDFTVTLTATDSDGRSSQATLAVHVDPPAQRKGVVVVARFDGTSGHGVAPDTERFDGSGSYSRDPQAKLASCAWDFGDGSHSQDCRTSHTFAQPGSFTVTLTAADTDGAQATAALSVQVDPERGGTIRWQKSLPSEGHVGTDFDQQVAVAYDAVIEAVDPDNGHTLWAKRFALPPDSLYQSAFRGPLFILPGTNEVYAELAQSGGPAPFTNICRYAPDGTQACVGGSLEDMGTVLPISMGAGGEVSWGFDGFPGVSASLARPDESVWTLQLRQGDATSHDPQLVDTNAEPGGDLLIALDAPTGYTFDGQTLGPGDVWMRVDPGGHLVWWEPTPFQVLDMGTTTLGTLVAVVKSPAAFSWGDGKAAGTALVVTESTGMPRLVRPLAGAESAQVSVLPGGRVSIAINRPACQGPIVYRYDLAGSEQWHHDFAAYGCDVQLAGVAIRPNDVLISGSLAGTTDFGNGPLPPGGFVLDLGG